MPVPLQKRQLVTTYTNRLLRCGWSAMPPFERKSAGVGPRASSAQGYSATSGQWISGFPNTKNLVDCSIVEFRIELHESSFSRKFRIEETSRRWGDSIVDS